MKKKPLKYSLGYFTSIIFFICYTVMSSTSSNVVVDIVDDLILDIVQYSENTDYCCICLEKLYQHNNCPSGKLITLCCNHTFHSTCFNVLSHHTSKCPLCKQYMCIACSENIPITYNNYISLDNGTEEECFPVLQFHLKNTVTCICLTLFCSSPIAIMMYLLANSNIIH